MNYGTSCACHLCHQRMYVRMHARARTTTFLDSPVTRGLVTAPPPPVSFRTGPEGPIVDGGPLAVAYVAALARASTPAPNARIAHAPARRAPAVPVDAGVGGITNGLAIRIIAAGFPAQTIVVTSERPMERPATTTNVAGLTAGTASTHRLALLVADRSPPSIGGVQHLGHLVAGASERPARSTLRAPSEGPIPSGPPALRHHRSPVRPAAAVGSLYVRSRGFLFAIGACARDVTHLFLSRHAWRLGAPYFPGLGAGTTPRHGPSEVDMTSEPKKPPKRRRTPVAPPMCRDCDRRRPRPRTEDVEAVSRRPGVPRGRTAP